MFLPNAGSSLPHHKFVLFYKMSTDCLSLLPLSHPQVSALHLGLRVLGDPQSSMNTSARVATHI